MLEINWQTKDEVRIAQEQGGGTIWIVAEKIEEKIEEPWKKEEEEQAVQEFRIFL